MPGPVLPSQALNQTPDMAQQQLIEHGPFESYTTVTYSGVNGGVPITGSFVETDADTWVENGIFTFQEIAETDEEVILYDASRDTTIFINLMTDDVTVQWASNELVWDVADVSMSLVPPDII